MISESADDTSAISSESGDLNKTRRVGLGVRGSLRVRLRVRAESPWRRRVRRSEFTARNHRPAGGRGLNPACSGLPVARGSP
jgi:hypothetical protein